MNWWQRLPWKHLGYIGLYFTVALLIVGRNPLTLADHFIGAETGDTYEMARNAWYFTYALQNGLPLFQQPLLGYPTGIDGSIFLSVPLQYFPIVLLHLLLPLTIAYNVVVLLYMALNGWAMYWLMRSLLREKQDVPALLAGLIYMAAPIFQAHLAEGHGGLMLGWAAPLYLWALFKLVRVEHHVWRWGLLTVLFFYLSTTGHILQAIYVLLPVSGAFFLGMIWKRDWQAAWRVLVMGLFASVLLLIALLPAIQSAAGETAYADTGGTVRYSADALAIVSPSFFHPVFDAVLAYPRQVLGINLAEGAAYVGIVAAALAFIALLNERESRWWLLLAIIAWVLSLGSLLKVYDQPVQLALNDAQTYLPMPFAFLQQLPGFNLARTPARFNFTLALAVAVMAGYGANIVWRRMGSRKNYILALVLSGLILFEYQTYWPQPLRPAAIPQAVYDLQDAEGVQAVFNIPSGHLLAAKDALYLQTAHQQPLIAGQITRATPVNPAKLAVLEATLDPALLRDAGASIVILHRARAAEIDQQEELEGRAEEQLGAPIYVDERIAIYEVPPPEESAPELVTLPVIGITTDQAHLDVYVSQPGWIELRGELIADNRDVALYLNANSLFEWELVEGSTIATPFAVIAPGYYRLTLALDPPCPDYYPEALTCSQLRYDLDAAFISDRLGEGGVFDGGIELRASQIDIEAQEIRVRLHWEYDQPRDEFDVRFVHLLNANGQLVAQSDLPPGSYSAGQQQTEIVAFALDDLPSGLYTVQVGWYRLVGDTPTNYPIAGQISLTIGQVDVP